MFTLDLLDLLLGCVLVCFALVSIATCLFVLWYCMLLVGVLCLYFLRLVYRLVCCFWFAAC